MRRESVRTLQLVCLLGILHISMAAQKPGGGQSAGQSGGPGGQSAQTTQGGGTGGSQGMPGLTYTPAEWPQLRLPSTGRPTRTRPRRKRSSLFVW